MSWQRPRPATWPHRFRTSEISTPTAVQVALIVNVILLLGVGWRMNPSDRQLGWRRICYALATGFQATSKDDFENMARQFPAYDALLAYCRTSEHQPVTAR